MATQFEVHLEYPYHAIRHYVDWPEGTAGGLEVTMRLLRVLQQHQIKAIFYILGDVARQSPELVRTIHAAGHRIGNHGFWHRHHEHQKDASYYLATNTIFEALKCQVSGPYPYRSPYWETTSRPGWCGGVFFRVLPYQWLKYEIQRAGIFYLHPHDLMGSTTGHWRRRVCFCDPWERLERLLNELSWMN